MPLVAGEPETGTFRLSWTQGCGRTRRLTRPGTRPHPAWTAITYGSAVRDVPWWGVVSSVAAPVLMVTGWTIAGDLQPRFDPVADTVSALAAQGATDRWVMTLTFLVVGACYVITALALRPAGPAGRLILITGALVGMLVAASPERPGVAYPVPHIITASVGLAGLVTWPAGAWRRGPAVPWGLRPAVAGAAVAVLFALLVWFGAELILGFSQVGLAERVAGGAQALWPLAVVLSCRYARPGIRSPG
jgi:hypothetical membrane protein